MGHMGHMERDDRPERIGRRPLEQVTCFKVKCISGNWFCKTLG